MSSSWLPLSGEDRAGNWSMDRVITEGYERSIWTFRSVEAIAHHGSRLKLFGGMNLGEDDEEKLTDHPFFRLLNKRANPLETGQQFKKRMFAQYKLSKKGVFVEVGHTRRGTPNRLDLLPPDRVRLIQDPHGDYLSHFEFTRHDGVIREIDPERIRWIRDAHPTDPFSGVTPLEAAGISVELDFLARYYNVNFIQNDSRPGGVLGVDTDGVGEQDLDRIQRQFQPGAHQAGQLAVIGTGKGGLGYVDTSAKPRDMNYGETSLTAKMEILAAFGVPESLFNASGRTFDNAEQELFNFWNETMIPDLEIIASAFEQDIPEEFDPYFDTTKIEVLELPRRRRREEALTEVQRGVRTIDEYRPLASLEPIGVAQSRALWISPALSPIPATPEDAEALGLGGPTPEPGISPDATPAGGTAADAVDEARATTDPIPGVLPADAGQAAAAVEEARTPVASAGPGPAQTALTEARTQAGTDGAGVPGPAAAAVRAALQTKTAAAEGVVFDPGDTETSRVELAVAAALDALLARQLGVITARLDSPKFRKGTPFWVPGPTRDTHEGTDLLNAEKIVDEDRWASEAQATLTPIAESAATAAAAEMIAALTQAGPETKALGDAVDAASVAARAAVLAVTVAIESFRGWARRVRAVIDNVAEVAPNIGDVIDVVTRTYTDHSRGVSSAVAVTVAQTAIGGAREDAAQAVARTQPAAKVVRTWVTQADAKVRDAHEDIAGTTLPVGEPFMAGGFPLRYPGDPFAPLALSRNCRCRLLYRRT